IERYTRSLDNNTWIYYMNGRTRKRIQFNSKGRTGPEVAKVETKSQNSAIEAEIHSETKMSTTDFEDKLMLLKKLLDKGLITQEEYDNKKAALLEEL
ncbi:MAG: hypothetical protein GY705_09470, partial [Bacteroidetes bacterium]|nr:hypothetical protein [Bacteroidota bacterium]